MFDIPYYKMLEKYLQIVGQDPRQRDIFRSIIVTIMVISITGILVPTVRETYRIVHFIEMYSLFIEIHFYKMYYNRNEKT